MENGARPTTTSIDWSAISKVYHNLPVIFMFLVTWATINKDFSAHELIQLYKVCYDIAWLLRINQWKKLVCDELGHLYSQTRQYEDAIVCYTQALELSEGSITEKYAYYNEIGVSYKSLGQYKKAMECYEKYLEICRHTGNLSDEGLIYNNIGNVHRFGFSQYQEAIDYYQKSLDIFQQTGDFARAARACHNIGELHQSLGQNKKAIEYFKKYLDFCQQGYVSISGDINVQPSKSKDVEYAGKEIGNLGVQGKVYCRIGNMHQSESQLTEAIANFMKSLDLFQQTGDFARAARACYNIGELHQSLGQNKKAIEYFNKYLDFCQQGYVSISGDINVQPSQSKDVEYAGKEIGNLGVQQKVYRQIGGMHQSLGQNKRAIESYKKSLEICKQIGDLEGQGTMYCIIGAIHKLLGQHKDAMQCCETALDICKTGNLRVQGMAYGTIGSIHKSRCQYDKVMECYEKSLAICQKVGDLSLQGKMYCNIGTVYTSRGQYQEALEYYQKGLQISKQTGDTTGEGVTYNNIGVIHKLVGEYDEAMNFYKKCLDICKQTGTFEAKASAYNNIGDAHFSLRQYEKAMEYYQKCLDICKQTDDLVQTGTVCGNIGNLYMALGQYKKGNEYYKKSLEIYQQTGDLDGEARFHNNIGIFYYKLSQYRKAILHFQKCLDICKRTGNVELEGYAYSNVGGTSVFLHDLSAAELHYKECIRCFEKLFSGLGQQDKSKVSIVDTYIRVYQSLTFVLVEVKKTEEALLISERSRSQALRDQLLQYGMASEDVKDTELYQDHRSLISSDDSTFVAFSFSFTAPGFKGLHTFVLSATGKVSVQKLSRYGMSCIVSGGAEKMLKSYVDKIIKDANTHVHEKRDNTFEDRSLGENDRNISQNAKLTNSCRASQNTFFSIVDREEPKECSDVISCPTSREAQPEKKSRLDSITVKPPTIVERTGEDLLMDLYQALIAPINDQLVAPEIVIIPDGPLFMLPFAALQSPDGQFLSDTKRIRIGPSLATLKLLKEYPVEKQSKTGALIVGGPIVRNVMFRGSFRKEFEDLPGAWEEATEIGKILKETPLTKESATKEEVMRRLKEGVAVIHIATHGSADTGELLLAPAPRDGPGDPTEEDYMLTVKDISSCKINAQLVVLSCCHSGRGQVRAEGVMGLTRAFLAAGARSVLAALWQISDEGTLFFMTSFYGHLKRGESACTSLQEAMREMKSHQRWSHPHYWGSFFIVGHDVTI